MRKAAGILTIIGTFIVGVSSSVFIAGALRAVPSIMLVLAVTGGVMALRRVHWRWALAGALCFVFTVIWLVILIDPIWLIFSPMGILAVIFLTKRKGEFD